MARASAPDWPRMMRRATAALYCDMTPSEFEREVSSGRLPCPVVLGGEQRWSRVQIDETLERLTGSGSAPAADWRAGQPLYSRG
jgi:predicted DNA-binding transcriptional regulator AlpA